MLRRARQRSPGVSKPSLDNSLNRANAARRAAHRVRIAPPSGCQHLATSDAQSEAVGRTARGDAHAGHDGAPSSIGVRTGTADSLSPRQTPRGCAEGSPHLARVLPLERPPRCALPPTRVRGGRVSHPGCVRSRTEVNGLVDLREQRVRIARAPVVWTHRLAGERGETG